MAVRWHQKPEAAIAADKILPVPGSSAAEGDARTTFGALRTWILGASDQQLKDWTESGSYECTSITRNTNGVVTTATVKWPDGSAGTFTATTINSTFNAIDAYTITHADAGRKVTQAAVTRNAAGEVTAKPALTVGDV